MLVGRQGDSRVLIALFWRFPADISLFRRLIIFRLAKPSFQRLGVDIGWFPRWLVKRVVVVKRVSNTIFTRTVWLIFLASSVVSRPVAA